MPASRLINNDKQTGCVGRHPATPADTEWFELGKEGTGWTPDRRGLTLDQLVLVRIQAGQQGTAERKLLMSH